MTETEIIEVMRQAMITVLKMAGPLMLVALVVGLIVSLFQALTQIQEMTLAFVPKIFFIFLFAIFFFPTMFSILTAFGEDLFDQMVKID